MYKEKSFCSNIPLKVSLFNTMTAVVNVENKRISSLLISFMIANFDVLYIILIPFHVFKEERVLLDNNEIEKQPAL
jgi:hypothetical protein